MAVYVTSEAIITIDFAEVDGSPVERETDRGFEAVRTLTCAWDDRLTLVRQLRGETNQGINLIVRRIGHRYPDKSAAIAMEVQIKPFHPLNKTQNVGASFVNKYDQAELTVTYRIPDGHDEPSPDQNSQDIFVTENIEPSVEFLTIPTEKLFFDATATTAIDVSPSLILVAADWIYTLHNLSAIPEGTFDLIGNTNREQHQSNKFNRTFEPETLLYNLPTLDPRINADGKQLYTITYRFTHRPVGWNNKIKPGEFLVEDGVRSPKFVPIFTEDGDVYKFYPPKSFKSIISS